MPCNKFLTTKYALTDTNHTSWQGRGRSSKTLETNVLNKRRNFYNGSKRWNEAPGFGGVQFFKPNVFNFKFGFELKNFSGLFGTTLLFGIGFFAAGFFCGSRFFATIGKLIRVAWSHRIIDFRLTGIIRCKKRNRRFTNAITINLLDAHANGGT